MITLGDRKGNLGVQIATMGSVLLVYLYTKSSKDTGPYTLLLGLSGLQP